VLEVRITMKPRPRLLPIGFAFPRELATETTTAQRCLAGQRAVSRLDWPVTPERRGSIF